MNQIIRDGRRQSMARSYLYPVLARKNVTLLVRTHVDRVTFDGTRATGVEIAQAGGARRIQARSEVILSSGGINTPKLLMLSGIGDEAQLRQHSIKVLVHAPHVGENFQDHILHGGCIWEPKEYLPHRNSAANASGFVKSQPSLATPDVNLVQIELPYASEVVAKQYEPPKTAWALCSGLVGPKSRGAVRLRSADPADRPIVDARFLSHPDDVRALAYGIELCCEIGNSPGLRDYVKREVAPRQKADRTGDGRVRAQWRHHLLPPGRHLPDGSGCAGGGRRQAAGERCAAPSHRGQLRHAPHPRRRDHGELRLDRRAHGGNPGQGGLTALIVPFTDR